MSSTVAIVRTSPATVLDDIARAMDLAGADAHLTGERELLLKLNLSWTKYFPACSSQPWQLEGVVRYLLSHGYAADRLIPVENKTVVTDRPGPSGTGIYPFWTMGLAMPCTILFQ